MFRESGKAHLKHWGLNIQHVRFYGLQSPDSTGYQGFKGPIPVILEIRAAQ